MQTQVSIGHLHVAAFVAAIPAPDLSQLYLKNFDLILTTTKSGCALRCAQWPLSTPPAPLPTHYHYLHFLSLWRHLSCLLKLAMSPSMLQIACIKFSPAKQSGRLRSSFSFASTNHFLPYFFIRACLPASRAVLGEYSQERERRFQSYIAVVMWVRVLLGAHCKVRLSCSQLQGK